MKLLALVLMMCTSTLSNAGESEAGSNVMARDKQISQFKRGETKEADIVAALGKPPSFAEYNGGKMIIYPGVIFKISASGVLTDIVFNP